MRGGGRTTIRQKFASYAFSFNYISKEECTISNTFYEYIYVFDMLQNVNVILDE